jgi:anion-transporting  ArsA/GET3 family ATPase
VTRVVLVTGAGGVGKTTLSAALAADAAREGRRTLVLTVDPARRLADTLGVSLGNDPTPTGLHPELWGAMLDAEASWEAIIRRHADPDTVDRLLSSPFFRAVADRFPAGQAYAAAEEMSGHLESGDFDVVVVDTPPSGGGIEFFASPGRIRSLVGGRVLRWLTGARIPGRRRLYSITARPVLKVADTVLGGPLLEDVAEFLLDLRTAYDGVSRRARQVEAHFRMAVVVVVTTADPTPLREAVRFFDHLPETAARPRAVVFNRVLPASWTAAGADPKDPLTTNLERWAAEAQRQADARQEFAAQQGIEPIMIPWLPDPPTSAEGLTDLLERAEGLDRRVLLGE